MPGTAAVLVPYLLWWRHSLTLPVQIGILQYVGVLPILLGVSIYCWCAWEFTFAGKGTPAPIDPPKELVVRGLYRYVRNPIYIGASLVLCGEAVLFESLSAFEYAVGVFVFFHLFVILYEEPTLRCKFGESYQRYCKSVPRWIPRTIHLLAPTRQS